MVRDDFQLLDVGPIWVAAWRHSKDSDVSRDARNFRFLTADIGKLRFIFRIGARLRDWHADVTIKDSYQMDLWRSDRGRSIPRDRQLRVIVGPSTQTPRDGWEGQWETTLTLSGIPRLGDTLDLEWPRLSDDDEWIVEQVAWTDKHMPWVGVKPRLATTAILLDHDADHREQ